MLCALMQPMQSNCELRFEQQNKHVLLRHDIFVEHLIQLIVGHVVCLSINSYNYNLLETRYGSFGYCQYA